MEEVVERRDIGTQKFNFICIRTCELCHVFLKGTVVSGLCKIHCRVAVDKISFVPDKNNLLPLLIHVNCSHMYVTNSFIVVYILVRPNRKKAESKFELFFSCVEGLRILVVHIPQNRVLDKVRLTMSHQLNKLDQSI